MFELIFVGLVLFGGMILLPALYELGLWLHRRRCVRKLRAFEKEVRSHADHDREAS